MAAMRHLGAPAGPESEDRPAEHTDPYQYLPLMTPCVASLVSAGAEESWDSDDCRSFLIEVGKPRREIMRSALEKVLELLKDGYLPENVAEDLLRYVVAVEVSEDVSDMVEDELSGLVPWISSSDAENRKLHVRHVQHRGPLRSRLVSG